jgi:S-adenosyl-L-methionine hydrolase (adenosine-forming)
VPGPIVTLTTDYGTSDHLVGTLKGVLLSIHPEIQIVDICHTVVPFDVLDGALCIGAAYKYFPARTVHMVIVDPGVGSARRPILVSANNQYFVAPDNGVLSMVYERENPVSVRHITSEHYFQRPVSETFHGRDIFAPVAAWLTKNWQSEAFGEVIEDHVRFALPRPKTQDGAMRGAVMKVDHFGNLMTNFTLEDLPEAKRQPGPIAMTVGGKPVKQMVGNFSQAPAGEAVALVGSSGFIEVAVNKGNAARALAVNRGAEVILQIA